MSWKSETIGSEVISHSSAGDESKIGSKIWFYIWQILFKQNPTDMSIKKHMRESILSNPSVKLCNTEIIIYPDNLLLKSGGTTE